MFSFSSPPQLSSFQRPSLAYSPQTPSPLRTSHNANRMSNRNSNSNIGSSPLSEGTTYNSIEQDENAFFPEQTPKSLVATTTTTTPSTSTSQSSSKAFAFAFAFDQSITPQASVTSSSSLFAYDQRARSSSPAAQLSKHATDAREKRKSMFLDRIRNRREEKRDQGVEEKVLRMDYVNERRAWEELMARQASIPEMSEDEDGDREMEMGGGVDVVDQGMGRGDEPGPMEEQEIEELVSFLEEQEGGQGSDDEYDLLFRELSASQGGGGGDGGGGGSSSNGMDMDMHMS